jgi:putative transposase
MVASMTGKGDCYDNAVAESFLSTLEVEPLMRNDWHTKEDARRSIFRYIETRYNRKRRHSTLRYLSPADYELQVQEAAQVLSLTRPLDRGKLKRPIEARRVH